MGGVGECFLKAPFGAFKGLGVWGYPQTLYSFVFLQHSHLVNLVNYSKYPGLLVFKCFGHG